MALVLIDVDGTLIGAPSSEQQFIRRLARTGVLGPRQYLAALAFALGQSRRYGRHVWKKNKAYLSGLSVSAVQAHGEHFVRTRLLARLRPDMRLRIEAHRRTGDTLALLTGTPDFLARPLAAHLGIEHCCATVCACREGCFSAAPPLVHPFGEAKVELAQALCETLGFQLADCIAYADSRHDLPLLQRVGQPVAVHPDQPLEWTALTRGWEILRA